MNRKRMSFKNYQKIIAILLVVGMIVSMMNPLSKNVAKAAQASYLLSQGKTAFASTVNGWNYANRAVDGDTYTGWESVWKEDPQWIYVDLGANVTVTGVQLTWDWGAYAKDLKIQVSTDEFTWSDVYNVKDNTLDSNNMNTFSFAPADGRYVRLYCEKRSAENYGYHLKEFQVLGYGGAVPPPVSKENIALNKTVVASSYEQKPHITPGTTDPKNVTDGDKGTRWSSNYSERTTSEMVNEWIYVDLGAVKTIGSVVLQWEGAYGRAFDIQVSNDASNWNTVYRQLEGRGNVETIPLYASGRYVRMYGHAKGSAFGYSMYEFEVYPYVEGADKPVYTIKDVPEKQVIQMGEGSYTEDITLMQPRNPYYKTDNVKTPIPSNKWWTSLLVNRWGNSLVTLPAKAEYEATGLAILYSGSGVATSDGGAVNANGEYDFFVNSNNLNPSKMEALVNDYSDYGVEVILTDNSTPKMVTNFVKGSPYYYFEFMDRNAVEIYSQHITKLFNDQGNAVLTKDGETITADHIGMEIKNLDENNELVTRNYGIFAPAGTLFRRVGNKIKIQLGSNENYMSVGVFPSAGDLNYLYQHAYAFVTDTITEYVVKQETSEVITTIKSTIELKRAGFSGNTLMSLLPHQWKKLDTGVNLTDKTYDSIRGTLKVYEGNSFTTVDHFNGIIPQFTEPENSEYSRNELINYLGWLERELDNNYWVADPYWHGKVMHPLASAILIADQIEETELRDKLVSILHEILANWLTYSGEDDVPYYMYYSPSWGTINGDGGDHGMAINLSDHHYLWAYFTYAAGVLGMYDEAFVRDYGAMVDLLIRDVGTPDREDEMFPYLRNFDPYEGHSWAGGYADNNSGANQEAAAECLFAWVGQYLWGTVTENKEYIDAAIYLYTTESYANKQYWFNYDGDNFPEGYQYGSVGMLFGSSINFGTYFSGAPENIYGIHWLPTSPHITIYGIEPEKADNLYKRFLLDLKKKEGRDSEIGWFHIIWPFQSMGDPNAALAKWNAEAIAKDGSINEVFNTYWFMNNMVSAGTRNGDLYCSNWSGYNIFKKDDKYTAMIWNPTDNDFVAEFKSFATGEVVGSIHVPAKSTISGDPTKEAGENPGPINSLKVQAENYTTMSGVQKEICNDTDGGENLGWIDTGDWMEYSVRIPKSGTYSADFRVKGWNENAFVELVKGGQVLTSLNAYTKDSWSTVSSSSFHLDKGIVTLRVKAVEGGFNFNWMELVPKDEVIVEPSFDYAKGKEVHASSVEEPFLAENAVDGNADTRWASEWTNDQWIYVDLGSVQSISKVLLKWEAAYGKAYEVQISSDSQNWQTVALVEDGNGNEDKIVFPAVNAQYVKINGIQRGSGYGYSLWSFEVY